MARQLDWRHAAVIYALFTLVFIILTIGAPVAALLGWNEIAAGLYNGAAPLCHQWDYRSWCIFNTTHGWSVDECIPQNYSAIQKTEFTVASHRWDGPFVYSRDQIGGNRADVIVLQDGTVGYKMSVCARDAAMYFGLVFAGIVFLLLHDRIKRAPSIIFLLLSIVPLGLDGTGQLLGLWESTNLMRGITGFIAGAVIGFYIIVLIREIFDNRSKR